MIEISVLPEPESHPLWPEIRGLLEPAARRGGVPVLEPNELVWLAYSGGIVFAAATTRITVDGGAEIILCGGCEHRLWAKALAERICDWARQEGAERVRIGGRLGWAKVLGWPVRGGVIERRLNV